MDIYQIRTDKVVCEVQTNIDFLEKERKHGKILIIANDFNFIGNSCIFTSSGTK